MQHEHDTRAETPGYGTYLLGWFALVVLTTITVTAAGMHFGNFSVLVALAIAAVKASVVLYLFMHLKYESRLFHVLLGVVIVTLAIFIGLTFTDVLFR